MLHLFRGSSTKLGKAHQEHRSARVDATYHEETGGAQPRFKENSSRGFSADSAINGGRDTETFATSARG